MKDNAASAIQADPLISLSRWMGIALLVFLTCMLLSCAKGDESSDDDSTPKQWTLISVYYYDYDSEDRLIREQDDNDASGTLGAIDDVWEYTYEDGRRSLHRKWDGSKWNQIPRPDPESIGTYFYNSNDCLSRLEENLAEGGTADTLLVWTYNVEDDCRRLSYHFEGDNTEETGTYTYDETTGKEIKLKLDSGEYWEYELDLNGDRLEYSYYTSKGTLYRTGTYVYDTKGRLDRLLNYEKR